MLRCAALLLVVLTAATGVHGFNATAFARLPHAKRLLSETWCLFTTPSVCDGGGSSLTRPRAMLTGLQQPDHGRRLGAAAAAAGGNAPACDATMCYHGAHMIPNLITRYGVRSLVEIGVCTGMSTASVVSRFGMTSALERYYLVDPWGGNKCKPGCACARHIHQMAKTWPDVLVPLRGYSVPMAAKIPNASLDLVYVDAAHDFRNA